MTIEGRLVRDTLRVAPIDDIEAATRATLAPVLSAARLRAGARVAVTAGSRGIARIPQILRAILAHERDAGLGEQRQML